MLTKEQTKQASSIRRKKAAEYVRNGYDQQTASIKGDEDTILELELDFDSVRQFRTGLGKATHFFHPISQTIKYRERKGETLHVQKTIGELYKLWCEQNNWAPPDKALAFFCDYSQSALSRARRSLIKQGYKFSSLGKNKGWQITVKPSPKPTQQALLQLQNRLSDQDVERIASAILRMSKD